MDDDLGIDARARQVMRLTDAICAEHLGPDYAPLCRTLVGRLVRRTPSPLVRGSAETWAAGIVLAAARHVHDSAAA